jgi:molybdate transport system substrate-binding protein
VRRWHVCLLVVVLSVLYGCGTTGEPAITVGAASSLQPLLDSVRADFEEETGITLHISYSASGTIARQIEQGAPIDVFVSAGTTYIDELAVSSFLREDSISTFAYGQLALVRPELPGAPAISFADAQRIAIANPEIAPYGAAARRLLESSGLWEDVQPRLVIAESALQAYQFAKSGEVDYAFVPQPLVRMSISGIVEGAPEPTGLGAMPTVSYVAAVTTRTTQEDHANAFVDYLTDPQIAVTDFGYDSVLGIP